MPSRHARRTGAFTLLVIALLAIGPRAAAQRTTSTLDVSSARVRYADSVSVSAFTVSPALQMNFARATVGISGAYSHLSAGSWTTQGDLGASLYTALAGALVGELSASAGGSAHQDGTRTAQSLAMARGHLMTARRGAWLGAGAGSTWDGIAWRRLFEGEAALWSRLGTDATALVTVTPAVVDDSIRYADAELAAHWDGTRAEVAASVGTRRGGRSASTLASVATWGSVSAAAWLTSSAAVIASAGTYPVDLTEGFPGGRFASVGLRIGSRARRTNAESSSRASDSEAAAPAPHGVQQFTVSAASAGQRTVRVLAPDAHSVELSADFTAWSPVRLTRLAGGWWSVTLPLEPGTHQVNLRVDGGAWLVPPPLMTLREELGGDVGLLVVPM